MCGVHWNALRCSTPFHSIVKHLEVKLCSRFHFPQYKFLTFKKERKKSREELRCTSRTGQFFLLWRIPLIVRESTPVIKKTTSCILILNWHSFSCSLCTFCYLRFLPTLSFLLPSYHYIPFIHPRCSNVWTIFAPFNLSFSWSISRSFLTLPLYSFHIPVLLSFSTSSPSTFFYWFSMFQYNVQHMLHSIFSQQRAFN